MEFVVFVYIPIVVVYLIGAVQLYNGPKYR